MFLAIGFYSCNNDDLGTRLNYSIAEITGAELPESFDSGEIYNIDVHYELANPCHNFVSFNFNEFEDPESESTYVIEVAAITSYDANLTECTQEGELSGTSTIQNISFNNMNYSTYRFKFLTGFGENEVGEFLIIDVPMEDAEN